MNPYFGLKLIKLPLQTVCKTLNKSYKFFKRNDFIYLFVLPVFLADLLKIMTLLANALHLDLYKLILSDDSDFQLSVPGYYCKY